MIFGYSNNAWLVVHNPDSSEQFQRGLNDDCFKSDTIRCSPWCSYSNSSNNFPVPFHLVLPPNAAMYVALHIARFLLVLQFMWFSFCILCCCNVKAELFAKQHRNLIMYFCGFTAFLFVILFLITVIACWSGSVIATLPQGYEEVLGSGFWMYGGGGTLFFLLSVFFVFREHISNYLIARRSHQALSCNEMVPLPS
ncbi:hypothetical protein Y032_0192g1343 [Ancylostoma ceylanicum]|nr:hypothetical protein Y032_0192g1343 [Ancylostoma ceylanicum]